MRNNTNNFSPPNHVTQAAFRAALRTYNDLHRILNNNSNPPTPDTSVVILSNAPDAHSTPLIGTEEQHTPTE